MNPNQYPNQGQYPPQQGGYPPQQGSYPPQGQYPPQQGGYPPQGGFPPQGQYPPQQGSYPPQGQYPPQQGAFPPQGQYPPQGMGNQYPPQQGGFPPQQGGFRPQGMGGLSPPPPPSSFGAFGRNYYNQIQQQERQRLYSWFLSVDKDKSGHIDVRELAMMPCPGNHPPFGGKPIGAGPAKALIKLFDKDRSGHIDFYEFAALNQFVNKCQQAFYAGDRDRSGTLNSREIHQALEFAGLVLEFKPVGVFYKQYDTTMRGLSIVQFMALAVKLATVKKHFDRLDKSKTGKIDLDGVLQIVAATSKPPKAGKGAKGGKGGKYGKGGNNNQCPQM